MRKGKSKKRQSPDIIHCPGEQLQQASSGKEKRGEKMYGKGKEWERIIL